MKIFYIIGKSGSGKTSLRDMLLAQKDLPLIKLEEVTTRPKRENESDDTYKFVDSDEYFSMCQSGKIMETRGYRVANGEEWFYGTLNPDELNPKGLYVSAGPLQAFESIRNLYGSDVIPIYLDVTDRNLLLRSIQREVPDSGIIYKEICRRFISDTEDFSQEKLDEIGIDPKLRVNANLTKIEVLTKVKAIIRRFSRSERM